MIIFKQSIIADHTYSVENLANCVIFDLHNDTPYNCGISFGRDTGIDNADYYVSPHSILYGVRAVGHAPSINNAIWSGTIYIFTETPLGTGLTNLACSPAFQLTLIGYPVGFQPSGTTSMTRMAAIANEVTTNVNNATLINTSNTAGTLDIIEVANTTSSGDITTLDNSGNFKNGNAAFPGTISFDNAKITSDGSGDLSVVEIISTKGLKGPTGDFFCRTGDTAGTGTGTVNHNLGAVPDFMAITTHVNGSQTVGYDSETSTQVHVTAGAGLAWFGLLTKRS